MLTPLARLSPRQSYPGRRWLAVGHSALPGGYAAGTEAARAAIAGRDATLLLVFCWDGYDLKALLDGIAGVAPGVPLVGCSTAGEIAGGGPGDGGVVVAGFGGDGFTVATAAAGVEDGALRQAGAKAAECTSLLGRGRHRVLLRGQPRVRARRSTRAGFVPGAARRTTRGPHRCQPLHSFRPHPPFDCVARRGVLGDVGIEREVSRIAAHAGGAPVAGFYTYGEIARTRGVRGFHNQTLVVLAGG